MSKKLDDLINECAKEFLSTGGGNVADIQKDEEKEREKAFFFGDPTIKYPPGDEIRRKNGECPVCGQPGYIKLSAFICEKHGIF